MATNKNQHYVPRCYLRPFSVGAGIEAISLLNIDRSLFVERAPLKSQCSRSYFYGTDQNLEDAIQATESGYARVLREINGDAFQLHEGCRRILRIFWLLQHMRTEAASRRIVEMTEGLGEDLEIPPEQYKLSIKEAVQESMLTFAKEIEVMDDMKIVLIKNKSKFDFVTSDNPAVMTNKWFSIDARVKHQSYGMVSAGNIMILPMTPRLLCLGYDGDMYSVSHKHGWVAVQNRSDVDAFNAHQHVNCRANIFCVNRQGFVHALEQQNQLTQDRIEFTHRINYGVLDHETAEYRQYRASTIEEARDHSDPFMHVENVRSIVRSWPSIVKWRGNAHAYYNGSGIGYIRKKSVQKSPAEDRDSFNKVRARLR